MNKYHIFHLDTNEDTPGNVLRLWMGEYNFADWKKTTNELYNYFLYY